MPINLPTYEQQQQAITLLQELGVDVDTLLAGRVVKSVQRGTMTPTTSNGANLMATVTISPVNTDKTLTFSNATPTITTNQSTATRTNLASSNTLEIFYMAVSGNNPIITWQVIEFY